MALTKEQIQELIDTNLASGTAIKAVKHRQVASELLNFADAIGINSPKNIGWFSGLNVGSMTVGNTLSISGNISSAQVTFNTAGLTVLRCTMSNAMVDTNYKVSSEIESQAGFDPDSRILAPVFTPISTTTFDWAMRESSSAVTSLKIHISVTQL